MNMTAGKKFGATLATALSRWQTRWQTFSPSSRRVILMATAVLSIGLLWAFIYAPLQSSRAADVKRIAALQAQLQTMQRHAAEITALKSVAPAAAARVQTLADKNGLDSIFGAAGKVEMTANATFRVTSPRIRYADWLDGVDQALARFRLRIVSVDIKRLAAPTGQAVGGTDVIAEITFADAARGAGN